MFYNFSEIGVDGLLLFGAFVFVGIYGYTTLMDRTEYAVYIEGVRGICGILLILFTGDWFGVNGYLSSGSWLIVAYFLVTIFGGVYFTYWERDSINSKVAI